MFHMDVSKVDRGVTHVAMAPMAGGQRPVAGLWLLPRVFLARRTLLSPLPSLPSFPFPSLHLATARWGTLLDEATSGGGGPSGPTATRCPRGDTGSAPSAR
jgi:hypothetical protein